MTAVDVERAHERSDPYPLAPHGAGGCVVQMSSTASGSSSSSSQQAATRPSRTWYRPTVDQRRDAVAVAASRANRAVRAGLQGFVAEGQRLLADYLAARVAAGELRPHDTGAAAQLLLSTVALGQVTGAGVDPAAAVDVLLHGLAATPQDAPDRGGR